MKFPWTRAEPDIAGQVAEGIANAMREIRHNDTAATGLRGAISRALRSGTNDGADTLHDIYLDYGYPLELTFTHLWNMYRRFGIARNAVHLPVEACWSTLPEIKGGEALGREIDALDSSVQFWTRLKGLDTRQRVGRYAGMFMRVRDGKAPDQKIDAKLNGPAALVQMVPLYESQLEVLETDTDPKSDTYGLPTMYQFRGGESGNRSDKTPTTFNIHPSRVVIAAEGADNGDIYGIPALEACYNSLMDLRKVIGAGGEGFYRNAAQSVVFKQLPTEGYSAVVDPTLMAEFNTQFDDFTRNRARRGFFSPGLDAQVMESNLVPADTYFTNAINDVAAATGIPATILIGQQTGRLASSEDSRQFLAGQNSRRTNFLTQMTADVIDWCMQYGILAKVAYEIEWDDLLAMSDTEKLDNADKMAGVNEKQFKAGGSPVFSEDEIREAAGHEVEDLPVPDETVPPDAEE